MTSWSFLFFVFLLAETHISMAHTHQQKDFRTGEYQPSKFSDFEPHIFEQSDFDSNEHKSQYENDLLTSGETSSSSEVIRSKRSNPQTARPKHLNFTDTLNTSTSALTTSTSDDEPVGGVPNSTDPVMSSPASVTSPVSHSELMLENPASTSSDLIPSISKLLNFSPSKETSLDWATLNADLLLDEAMPNEKFLQLLDSVANISDLVVSDEFLSNMIKLTTVSNASLSNVSDHLTSINNSTELAKSTNNLSTILVSRTQNLDLIELSTKATEFNTASAEHRPLITYFYDLTELTQLTKGALEKKTAIGLCSKVPDLRNLCSKVQALEKQCLGTTYPANLCSVLQSRKSLCIDLPDFEQLCSSASPVHIFSFSYRIILLFSVTIILW